jgi:surfactin synthase thioesterase subunit
MTGRTTIPSTVESPTFTVDAVRWPSRSRARIRLFCLPHAGGGAASYFAWARRLAPEIEVVSVRYPGRETRHREPPARRMAQIVPAIADAICDEAETGPYAVFGHSYGALAAFEVCRELAGRGAPAPARLLVSGRPAPHLQPRLSPVHDAGDAKLLARLRQMGGTPPEILADAGLMAGLLPTLRADLEAAETYLLHPGPALDTPISVFGGDQDLYTKPSDLWAWAQYTRSGHRVRIYRGRHFFLYDDPEPVLADLRADLLDPLSLPHLSNRPM